MKHGSLFSGIGGFDLAASWMGWENVFHCEWNKFGQQVLKHHFPNSVSYDDICKTDFTLWRGKVDIISGGFPCQPYSMAGKRKGTEDSRHLWPEMLRAIRECRPTWIVGENVPGLINWSGGLVFEQVCAELEGEGYEVQPYLLPACGVDAPHKRERVWFVAHSGSKRNTQKAYGWEKQIINNRQNLRDNINTVSDSKTFTNTGSEQLQEQGGQLSRPICTTWENFPTQSPICSGNDGIPDRLDNITFPKWRNESIKGYGNAIVPQVAYQIFKVIDEMNKQL